MMSILQRQVEVMPCLPVHPALCAIQGVMFAWIGSFGVVLLCPELRSVLSYCFSHTAVPRGLACWMPCIIHLPQGHLCPANSRLTSGLAHLVLFIPQVMAFL